MTLTWRHNHTRPSCQFFRCPGMGPRGVWDEDNLPYNGGRQRSFLCVQKSVHLCKVVRGELYRLCSHYSSVSSTCAFCVCEPCVREWQPYGTTAVPSRCGHINLQQRRLGLGLGKPRPIIWRLPLLLLGSCCEGSATVIWPSKRTESLPKRLIGYFTVWLGLLTTAVVW